MSKKTGIMVFSMLVAVLLPVMVIVPAGGGMPGCANPGIVDDKRLSTFTAGRGANYTIAWCRGSRICRLVVTSIHLSGMSWINTCQKDNHMLGARGHGAAIKNREFGLIQVLFIQAHRTPVSDLLNGH